MSQPAISAQHIGKSYRIGSARRHDTLRDRLAADLRGVFRRPGPAADQTIWALHDVSFEVRAGEVIGVIGRNGAGKSTLLKILSEITPPSRGRAELNGRVASLLEVGTGFHPELTGRENIFLNGAILGMRRTEIARRFDEIVAFAEVEKFVDTPVKHYSSGMYVRLAFAVAAHLEPEILLVDEVLAVGDMAFQQKCLGKMSAVAGEGRTVLFVSHNEHAISTLTRRALLIDGGQLVFDGPTATAMSRYRTIFKDVLSGDHADADKKLGVTAAKVITSDANGVHRFGEPLAFEFDIRWPAKPKSGTFSFQILDEQSRAIVHQWIYDSAQPWTRQGKVSLRCEIPQPRLYRGRYCVVTHVADRGTNEYFEKLTGICPFEIVMDGLPDEFDWAPGRCVYLEDGKWSVC